MYKKNAKNRQINRTANYIFDECKYLFLFIFLIILFYNIAKVYGG